jgi:hypothetical protein
VRQIPRSSTPTPDFEVDGDAPHYLVEVKGRRDEDALHNFEAQEVYLRSQHCYWSMSVYGGVKKAVRQFECYDPAHVRRWVLWFSAADLLTLGSSGEQVRGTLLGINGVIDLSGMNERGVSSKDCFYAQRGAFERFSQIDAAILSTANTLEMWINEFANRTTSADRV